MFWIHDVNFVNLVGGVGVIVFGARGFNYVNLVVGSVYLVNGRLENYIQLNRVNPFDSIGAKRSA